MKKSKAQTDREVMIGRGINQKKLAEMLRKSEPKKPAPKKKYV